MTTVETGLRDPLCGSSPLKKAALIPSSGLRTCFESLSMSGELRAPEGFPLTLRGPTGEDAGLERP